MKAAYKSNLLSLCAGKRCCGGSCAWAAESRWLPPGLTRSLYAWPSLTSSDSLGQLISFSSQVGQLGPCFCRSSFWHVSSFNVSESLTFDLSVLSRAGSVLAAAGALFDESVRHKYTIYMHHHHSMWLPLRMPEIGVCVFQSINTQSLGTARNYINCDDGARLCLHVARASTGSRRWDGSWFAVSFLVDRVVGSSSCIVLIF